MKKSISQQTNETIISFLHQHLLRIYLTGMRRPRRRRGHLGSWNRKWNRLCLFLFVFVCFGLSLSAFFVFVCFSLSYLYLFYLFVFVCIFLSLFVLVCLCLSLFVFVCLRIYLTAMHRPRRRRGHLKSWNRKWNQLCLSFAKLPPRAFSYIGRFSKAFTNFQSAAGYIWMHFQNGKYLFLIKKPMRAKN